VQDADRKAAEEHGLLLEYRDALGARRRSPEASVRTVLEALGPKARGVEPIVLWDGAGSVPAHVESVSSDPAAATHWVCEARDGVIEGVPFGVHAVAGTVCISAPRQAYGAGLGGWSLFAPLYALHERTSATPSFEMLGRLVQRVRALRGRGVSTLPLLAVAHERGDVSPYSPFSRLFWNELFVDLEGARPVVPNVDPESREIDMRAWSCDHWRALEEMRGQTTPEARASLERHAVPDLDRYATERASGGPTWLSADLVRFAQLRARAQMAALGADGGLQLDLPIGVAADSFDVARWPALFLEGLSVGAPPDPLFSSGQSWGLPPMHPERDRRTGYAYLRRCLAHHAEHADVLRFDHAAGLERTFVVPDGADAREGVYIAQRRPEELYALLTLASHEHRCAIVGEDLGTVPIALTDAMRTHGLFRSFVTYFEWTEDGLSDADAAAFVSVGTHDLPMFAAWMRAHDVLEWVRLGLLDDEAAERQRADRRDQVARLRALLGVESNRPTEVHRALVTRLGARPHARLVVALEDLLGESVPQNVPGTSPHARPNWRLRMREPVESLDRESWLTTL
jgi:4-alpha-glucanotransferase